MLPYSPLANYIHHSHSLTPYLIVLTNSFATSTVTLTPSPHTLHPSPLTLLNPILLQLPEELRPVNLLETRNILPAEPLEHPSIKLSSAYSHCQPNPSIICSTLNTVPATHNLLSKVKLPLGIHVHPFKRAAMPVLHPNVIIRCRVCRAYINPFASFIDSRHWRCNLCFRSNELPEDFNYNQHSGDVSRSHRKELYHASVEYIASSEYMLRPPQPCTYFFLIDVSHNAVNSGMLSTVCATLLENIDSLPGDVRTLVGIMTYDSRLHFYNLQANLAQFEMMVVTDLEEVFIPMPGTLLVNLREGKDMIRNLLEELPRMFTHNLSVDSALGAALTAACKILSPVGGRVTVFQTSAPTKGPGATKTKEGTKSSVSKEKVQLAPSTDFYKSLALDCCGQQIAVDMFLFAQQHVDYASIACIAQVSSGQIYYYPGYHSNDITMKERVTKDLVHYLTRPIGFEAVMRIRCTQGIGLHAFFGNFFVRSSDLLSLPNVSPDMGYAVSLSIDETLKDIQMVCVQTALLYTSARGERRIRVHTIALPVSDKLADIYAGCNVQAVTGMLAKMAADRVAASCLGDAREALMNAVTDGIKAYKTHMQSSAQAGFLSLPYSLRLLPMFVLALMKHPAFSLVARTTLDARADAMNTMKTMPLDALMVHIYPHLCSLSGLTPDQVKEDSKTKKKTIVPLRLHSSAEKLQRNSIFLLNCGAELLIWVGQAVHPSQIQEIFGAADFSSLQDGLTVLPVLDNTLSDIVTSLVEQSRRDQPKFATIRVIKEPSPNRILFADRLVEDKTEAAFSYQEFLQHIRNQLSK